MFVLRHRQTGKLATDANGHPLTFTRYADAFNLRAERGAEYSVVETAAPVSRTRLDPEEYAYPSGGFHRRGRAILAQNPHNPITLPYGEVRAVRASIPDTFFTIPAKLRYRGVTVRGFLTCSDDTGGEWTFQPETDPDRCEVCAENDGCKFRRN